MRLRAKRGYTTFGRSGHATSSSVANSIPGPPVGSITRVSAILKSAAFATRLLCRNCDAKRRCHAASSCMMYPLKKCAQLRCFDQPLGGGERQDRNVSVKTPVPQLAKTLSLYAGDKAKQSCLHRIELIRMIATAPNDIVTQHRLTLGIRHG
jgi:hypothetical protein